MLLETGGQQVRFRQQPIAGTNERLRAIAPETLFLDGQQRLTSLYRALMSTVAVETKDTKGKPIRHWCSLDRKQAVSNKDDREDAVLSVLEDRQLKAFVGEITIGMSTLEKEYASDLFSGESDLP